jgi:peptidoglycan/xylan/chitin deacetylase (PgdA/CDA1 family)
VAKRWQSAVILVAAMGFIATTSPVSATDVTPPPTDPETTTTSSTIPQLRFRDIKVISRVRTKDNVVFITIDDGFTPTDELAKLLKRYKIPITTFAKPRQISLNKRWFLSQDNMTFENHTVNHTPLSTRSLSFQRREICNANKQIRRLTGQRPVYFRPPGGSFNNVTKKAMAKCGIERLIMWSVIAEKNKLYIPNGKLQKGDIILMHYINSTASTLELLLTKMKADGMRPALLRDYLK